MSRFIKTGKEGRCNFCIATGPELKLIKYAYKINITDGITIARFVKTS